MFPLCDGFRLLLSMAIDGPIARNNHSVGTPLNENENPTFHFYFFNKGRRENSKDVVTNLSLKLATSGN